ncbi:MAG: hypothetical protein AAF570_08680, partial [Bacteroidota bacterium]
MRAVHIVIMTMIRVHCGSRRIEVSAWALVYFRYKRKIGNMAETSMRRLPQWTRIMVMITIWTARNVL